jgi:hypothetical protein
LEPTGFQSLVVSELYQIVVPFLSAILASLTIEYPISSTKYGNGQFPKNLEFHDFPIEPSIYGWYFPWIKTAIHPEKIISFPRFPQSVQAVRAGGRLEFPAYPIDGAEGHTLCSRTGLIPSGKHTQNYRKSPFSMGNSTINGYFQ